MQLTGLFNEEVFNSGLHSTLLICIYIQIREGKTLGGGGGGGGGGRAIREGKTLAGGTRRCVCVCVVCVCVCVCVCMCVCRHNVACLYRTMSASHETPPIHICKRYVSMCFPPTFL